MNLRNLVHDYVNALMPNLATMSEGTTRFAVLGDSDGDSCLFNGLLASVCDVDANWFLSAVLSCQGSNGMFYRSPKRRATNNEGYSSFFSRDMATGVMAAACRGAFPKEAWDNWLNYIDRSRPCKVKKPKWMGGGCLVRDPMYYYAPDDRSAISPTCWAMMGRVADGRGWPKCAEMKTWDKCDGDVSVLESQNCEKGYQLHLKAVDAFIKYLLNQSSEYSIKVGKIAFERVPDNLFYEFLATRTINDQFVMRYLDLAPPVKYKFGNAWVWEKSSVESHIELTCGWDFLFLGFLILRYWVS